MPPTLYLIDGHALAYRTYFALTGIGGDVSRWVTTSGEQTAGIYGFASVLLRIIEQERPDYLAVAFDVGKTFRDEIFPEYKGTREKMPDDLRAQIERIRELVDTFNIPRLEMEGYEADDVLGSVARTISEQGIGVKIITGDRDLLQLVTERVIVSLPGRKLSESQDYLPKDVKEKMGVTPAQVVDYKALVGDKSDNIPGVAGIGQKSAEKFLETYGTLDEIYAHLDELKPGQQKKMEAGKENAYLSQKLATIVTDLDIDIDLEKAKIEHFDPKAIQALFRELEFRTLMPRLVNIMQMLGITSPDSGEQLNMFAPAADKETTKAAFDTDTIIVDTPESLEEMVKQLESASIIAFDTETTSTNKMEAQLVGISLAVEPKKGYYIPVGHNPDQGDQLPLKSVIEAISPAMTSTKIPKAGHNLKYDYVMLARNGLEVTPLSFDSMIAEWLCNSSSRNLGLKNLAWVRLDIEMTEISVLIGAGKKQITMAEVAVEKAAPYAAADAEVVLRLMPSLQKELKQKNATDLFENLELPLIPVLAKMEMAGISLDVAHLKTMSVELKKRIGEIRGQVYQSVGWEFNLNSTQQLSEALFERLKLKPPDGTRKTASGHYSTAADVLEALQDDSPVIAWILENRELAKLQSTYVVALQAQINSTTQRVHTSYNQSGSVTGRIASSNPNLQNIPIRSEIGRKVRDAFVAAPGKLLLAVDYSQIELRVVAHMADDKAMLSAFQAGQDIHSTTAAAIYEIPINEINQDQRRHAKAINFGLIYGMSAFGLTRTTDLTLAEAENFVETYFNQFPGVRDFLNELRKRAAAQGYVETLLGRRRYFHNLNNQSNQIVRKREEREAINSPIQGTAADIMKLAMLAVASSLTESKLDVTMLLQVHDELVLECREDDIASAAQLVQDRMASAYTLKVPLQTEARVGVNWGKMTPFDAKSNNNV